MHNVTLPNKIKCGTNENKEDEAREHCREKKLSVEQMKTRRQKITQYSWQQVVHSNQKYYRYHWCKIAVSHEAGQTRWTI